MMLLVGGADIAAVDEHGRMPEELCTSRGARRAFSSWRSLQIGEEDAQDTLHAPEPPDLNLWRHTVDGQ